VRVAVLDHGMGNLRSVVRALDTAGAEVVVAATPRAVTHCSAVCVPGQGVFDRCMTNLARRGFGDAIREWIAAERPYLGICLGMQVLFEASEERGTHAGLGLLAGRSVRLPANAPVPHIGWNRVGEDWFYFDHSYAVRPASESIVEGWCDHGTRFAARIRSGSMTGVQFHPEKSSAAGLAFLRRWLSP
jgi:imidazole glycerol-phosphate synthase subunit HisH